MLGAITFGVLAQAEQPIVDSSTSGEFVKKRYSIKGTWSVVDVDGKKTITFSDDFKTRSGPDLKIYLSPKPIETLTGKTATAGSLKLGVLKSNQGEQSYILPDDVNLSDYKSIIVHCEAFSVLWGGFDIANEKD